jgi:hypothetical protein
MRAISEALAGRQALLAILFEPNLKGPAGARAQKMGTCGHRRRGSRLHGVGIGAVAHDCMVRA